MKNISQAFKCTQMIWRSGFNAYGGLRFYMSDKRPEDDEDAGPQTTLSSRDVNDLCGTNTQWFWTHTPLQVRIKDDSSYESKYHKQNNNNKSISYFNIT